MAILKIARMGHPVLREEAELIDPEEIHSDYIQILIDSMIDTLVEYEGLGLAAPQVHISKQLVILDITSLSENDSEEPSYLVLINPKISELSSEKCTFWEGCLSIPDLRGKVDRSNKIFVHAYNQQGKEITFTAEDFFATAIQHEVDHLKGILYVDRIRNTKNLAFETEYQRYILPEEQLQQIKKVSV